MNITTKFNIGEKVWVAEVREFIEERSKYKHWEIYVTEQEITSIRTKIFKVVGCVETAGVEYTLSYMPRLYSEDLLSSSQEIAINKVNALLLGITNGSWT